MPFRTPQDMEKLSQIIKAVRGPDGRSLEPSRFPGSAAPVVAFLLFWDGVAEGGFLMILVTFCHLILDDWEQNPGAGRQHDLH